MKKYILIVLMLLAQTSHAAWSSRLDLEASAQPLMIREINDGQWLAGLAHPNLWHLDHNENSIFHAGFFQAWNADNGNASLGLLAGVDFIGLSKELGADLPAIIGGISDAIHMPNTFKPATYFSQFLSADIFFGYRPIHTADVKGEFIWGIGASLNIPFGVGELKRGL